tara:strand:+ start:194 stop:538 length:345 start_codon:yes stop_codon:yes gene_type:complete
MRYSVPTAIEDTSERSVQSVDSTEISGRVFAIIGVLYKNNKLGTESKKSYRSGKTYSSNMYCETPSRTQIVTPIFSEGGRLGVTLSVLAAKPTPIRFICPLYYKNNIISNTVKV